MNHTARALFFSHGSLGLHVLHRKTTCTLKDELCNAYWIEDEHMLRLLYKIALQKFNPDYFPELSSSSVLCLIKTRPRTFSAFKMAAVSLGNQCLIAGEFKFIQIRSNPAHTLPYTTRDYVGRVSCAF